MYLSHYPALLTGLVHAWAVGLPAHQWWVVAMPYLVVGSARALIEVAHATHTRMGQQTTTHTDT